MKSLFKWLLRALASIAASEGGELLSVRRKAHLLEAQRYFRHAADAPVPTKGAARPATWAHGRHALRHPRSPAAPSPN